MASLAALKKHGDEVLKLKARVANAMEKADESVGQVVRTAEVSMGAFGMGIIHGRFKKKAEIVGVPAALATAVVLHGAGFAGIGGRNASHLHGFADGCLGGYMMTLGLSAGDKMAQKALTVTREVSETRGQIDGNGASGGSALSDEQMARLARAL